MGTPRHSAKTSCGMVAIRHAPGTVAKVSDTTPNDLERAIALIALEQGVLTPAAAVEVIRAGRASGDVLAQLRAAVDLTDLVKAIATARGIQFFDPYAGNPPFVFDNNVFRRADSQTLRRFSALPLVDANGGVVIAVANPDDLDMIDYLRSRYDKFALVLSPQQAVQSRITSYSAAEPDSGLLTQQPAPSTTTPSVRTQATTKSPVQEWLDRIFERAVSENASDVHMLMEDDGTMLLRFRVDGVLRPEAVPAGIRPTEAIGAILSRCETMDAANLREPQDGKFEFTADGRSIDARVGMLPQSHGPTVVVRILDSSSLRAGLDEMGFTNEQVSLMRDAIQATQGTVLAAGPTGSGKSTTLYALLQEVDFLRKNVLTVENPVEYQIPMIGQTEIRDDLGDRSLTFSRALRSILRLDPDVILVGEVRDTHTAETAMHAAITGHLVLSTLHANTALGSYARLTNMGLPAYLVAEALTLVLYQRLLRKVHDCATMRPPNEAEINQLATIGLKPPEQVSDAVGCAGCSGVGYRGRLAAVEVLAPSSEMRDLVTQEAPAAQLTAQARADGFQPIHVNAYSHITAGRTTVGELFRSLPINDIKEEWA